MPAPPAVAISLTGSPAMWSDFNEANKTAMMKSELLSWPVTMAIIVLAFGSLVAAGLPLLLTILGLVASAGVFALLTDGFDISIWAMNFALMFSLALGIDYALFIVHRFRGALFGSRLAGRDAVEATMDTAGKAVLFSGLTVLVSLSAVLLVPSPAFRSTALGIIVSVAFVLGRRSPCCPPCSRSSARRSTRCARRARPARQLTARRSLGRAALAPRVPARAAAALVLVGLVLPVLGLRTEMPSIAVVPTGDGARVGYDQLSAPSAPARRRAPDRRAGASGRGRRRGRPARSRHRTGASAGARHGWPRARAGDPGRRSGEPGRRATIERLRAALPAGTLVGGQATENHDLAARCGRRRRS